MTTDRRDRRGEPDRHKRPTVALRLPEDAHLWLEAYVAATGEARNAVIVQAIREYAARHST